MAQDLVVNVKLNTKESEAQMVKLKARAAELKAELKNGFLNTAAIQKNTQELAKVNQEMDKMSKNAPGIKKTSDEFGNFADTLGVVNVGMVAAQISMAAFSDGTAESAEQQRKFGMAVQAMVVIQQVANIESVKTKINKVQEALATKLTIKAKTSEIGITKGLTIVQKLWNKAVAANPILVLVAAITALVAVGVILWDLFKDQVVVQKEYNTAIDGTIIKNDELRASHNSTITNLKKLRLEYDLLTGAVDDYEYQLELLRIEQEGIAEEQKNTFEVLLKDQRAFWNERGDAIESQNWNEERIRKAFNDKSIRDAIIADGLLTDELIAFLVNRDVVIEKGILAEKTLTEKQRQKREDDAKKEYNDRLKAEAAFQKEIAVLKDGGDTLLASIEKKAAERRKVQQESVNAGTVEFYNEEEETIEDGIDKITAAYWKALEDQKVIDAENIERQKMIIDFAAQTALALNNVIIDGIHRRSEERINILEEEFNKESELLNQQFKQGIITQEQLDKKTNELDKKRIQKVKEERRKQAVSDKAAALFEIAINTAIGVSAAFKKGAILGGLESALILAAGAIQAGIVAAKPLPKFQDGGLLQGPSHAAGGIIYGNNEIEGREFIVNKSQTNQNLPLLEAINSGNGDMISEMNKRLDALIALNASPMRAYVSESDMTTTQARVKQIEMNATI